MKRVQLLLQTAILALALFAISKGRAQSLGPNGHYYQVVQEGNLLWDEAQSKAAQSTFNGVHGHLATITSADENDFIDSLRRQVAPALSVWIGGYQTTNAPSPTDGWFWVNGEGAISGLNGGPTFSNWGPGEPNSTLAAEYLALGAVSNLWSSEINDRHIGGYVIEYPSGGAATTVSLHGIDPNAIETSGAPSTLDIATFEFRREGDLSQDLPVFYSVSGTAQNGGDYDEISRSIVIAAGEATARLDIIPRTDVLGIVEPMETVGIRIEPSLILTPEAAYNINPAAREAAAVIFDLEPRPGLELAFPALTATFKYGEPIVLFAALNDTNDFTTIEFAAVDKTTGASNIIASASAANQTNDLAFYRTTWTNALPGTYFITARPVAAAAETLSSRSFEITVNTPTNTFVRIRAVSADNGTPFSDYASGYFEISRVGPTTQQLQVHYAISGSATEEADYEPLTGYAVIGANRTTARVIFTGIDDDVLEGNETLSLFLVENANYTIEPANRHATISIIDADSPAPTIPWEIISPLPTTEYLITSAFGNGVFVAANYSIFYSTDNGSNWKRADSGVGDLAIRALLFENGRFVAVGYGGRSWTSTDGINWTSHAMGGNYNTMTFGNGLFVAGSNEGIIATSADGATWSYNTTAAAAALHLSAFGNGRFILKEVTTDTVDWTRKAAETFVTSTDGVTWTRYHAAVPMPVNCGGRGLPCAYNNGFAGMTYLNGMFTATWGWPDFHGRKHLVSVDGVIWTEGTGIQRIGSFGLQTVNNCVVEFGPSELYSTVDLTTWQTNALPANSTPPRSVAFGNSTYVVVGHHGFIARGSDLNSLRRIDSPSKDAYVHSIAANGPTVVGATGAYYGTPARLIVSTNNGRTFDLAPNLSGHLALYSVRHADSRFVAVGENSGNGTAVFLRSTDGVSWSESSPATAGALRDVTFANNFWVAVGLGGTIVTSPDGLTLTPRNSGSDVDLFGIASGAGAIVAVGESGAILRSTNGINWGLNGTVEGSALFGVAFGNGIFVAVGENGRVYTSATGQSWTARRILGANTLTRIAFAHGLFTTIATNSNKVYVSANAISWSMTNLPYAILLGADSSDGKLWLSGKNSLIYREQSLAPVLTGGLSSNGRYLLTFDAPIAGNYRILSAPSCNGPTWTPVMQIPNATGRVVWEDTNALSGTRFYSVRREPSFRKD